MEYLKIRNTQEGLKLAECLIGSNCDNGFFHEFSRHKFEGVRNTGRVENSSFNFRENDGCAYDSPDVIMPVDSIVLNCFKCMEHQIPVLRNDCSKNTGTLQRFKREGTIGFFTMITHSGCEYIDESKAFSLDLERIKEINGVEVVFKESE